MTQYNQILQDLEQKLDLLETSSSDVLHNAEQGIKAASNTLDKLRALVVDHKFDEPISEINFFKNIKPQVFSKLIYFVKLFNINKSA